jgi:hypothetical protein
MKTNRSWAVLLFGAVQLGLASTAEAQAEDRRFTLEARGGVNVPTFDITDVADAGPSFGAGVGVQFAPRLWLMGDVDLGFHSGADLPGGAEGPDVKVYHYIAKVGYELLPPGDSRWSLIVNAGAGALTFDPDGADANTYPAINVGAKLGYELSPRVTFLLSPQGDIAFTDDEVLGTSDAWVWPITAGVRVGL